MVRESMRLKAVGLAAWLALSVLAAGVGGLASLDAPGFYGQLARPPWAPPAFVFGPVWSVLYLLMGIAAWQVWCERGRRSVRTALGLYLVQLVANTLWSWLFFHWRLGAVALAEVLLLWLLIVATVAAFWRVRRAAGLLLLPYLAWVSFATVLTWTLWRGNPGLL